MKRLFNTAAAGLLGTLVLFHPGFASEPEVREPAPRISAPPQKPSGTAISSKMTEVDRSVVFYANVLETADQIHFNGKATTSPEEMAQGALQSVLDHVFQQKFFDASTGKYDETGVTFHEVDGEKHVRSLTINGQTVTLEPPVIPLKSYVDQGRYLQAPIEKLSAETGLSIRRLFEQAVNGALHSSRDPHTSFLGEAEAKAMMQRTQGEFIGIGIQMGQKEGNLVVQQPMPGSPAEKAGLKAGDIILAVDGQPVKDMKLQDISKLILGDEGTNVILSIQRDNGPAFEQSVTRARIEIDAVEGRLVGPDKSTAHFQIKTFSEKTADDLLQTMRQLIQDAEKQGGAIKNIVLDFRDNPGGLLIQAEIIADLFLVQQPGGHDPIVAIGKSADEGQVFVDEVVNVNLSGGRVVVLQNQGSASASEVVAGALQDSGIPVVGTRSFGKGSVQSLVELSTRGKLPTPAQEFLGFQPGGMLKITIAAFFPGQSGLSNQGSGIIPNVKVVYNDIRDELEKKATREADLAHSLLSAQETRDGQVPDKVCTLKPEYAGPLSDETVAKLPPELVKTLNIFDEATETWTEAKFFDADLDAALNLLNGGSPYTTMTDYEAPANDNKKLPPAPQLQLAPSP